MHLLPSHVRIRRRKRRKRRRRKRRKRTVLPHRPRKTNPSPSAMSSRSSRSSRSLSLKRCVLNAHWTMVLNVVAVVCLSRPSQQSTCSRCLISNRSLNLKRFGIHLWYFENSASFAICFDQSHYYRFCFSCSEWSRMFLLSPFPIFLLSTHPPSAKNLTFVSYSWVTFLSFCLQIIKIPV